MFSETQPGTTSQPLTYALAAAVLSTTCITDESVLVISHPTASCSNLLGDQVS